MELSLEQINNVLKVIEPIYFTFKQELSNKKCSNEINILKLKNKNLKFKNKNLKLMRKNKNRIF